ncbi:MAG: hypothetical protein IIA45_03655 [Bacteroidetes bacterium]|nr:hypothetical protein [Bacteroidota bacterium]
MKRTIFISALLVFICYISNDVIASEKNKVEGQLVTDPGIMAISTTVDYDPLHPPNSYQTRSNPYYWKNKKPHGGYWQQDVHYIIKARIDEKTNIISGEEWLTYSNNSPDTLDHVFFHLYQNAFQPGSYYDMLQRENGRKPTFGRYEGKGLGTEIIEMKIGEQSLRMELDNTILKVYLTEKLLPGLNVEFYIKFKSYFDNGSMRRRMTMFNVYDQSEEDSITKTHRYKHYNGVHWYPRISVYDSKFGWTTDQHLDKEFYGDFGTYDIELDFANNYILGATGFLLNRQEMLPTRLRAKLDIKNFADKPMRSMPNRIIEYDESVRKIWKYHAENVHDFAFKKK